MQDPDIEAIARRYAGTDYPDLKPSGSVRASEACAAIGLILSCGGLAVMLAVLWFWVV